MSLHRIHLIILLLITVSFQSNGQPDSLQKKIEILARSLNARVSVSMLHVATNEQIHYNGNLRQPMLSVYKLPIALAVLNQIDEGKIKLDQNVEFNRTLIHPPDAEVFGVTNFPDNKISVRVLLTLMLVYGSNSACDILLDRIIQPKKVEKFIRSFGIKNITIANTEKELQASSTIQQQNSATANSLVKLLIAISKKEILHESSSNFLFKKMAECVTGPDRIKGMLPPETIVAHRTGTSSNVYNDIGIIMLPDGSHVIAVILISNANEYPDTCNSTIAKIARATWDHYSVK